MAPFRNARPGAALVARESESLVGAPTHQDVDRCRRECARLSEEMPRDRKPIEERWDTDEWPDGADEKKDVGESERSEDSREASGADRGGGDHRDPHARD